VERADISRRLKAARALAGVKVAELADRQQLRANGITANLVGEIERQERDARPMELRVIAEALELPGWFFTAELGPSTPAPSVASDESGVVRRLDALETVLKRIDSRLDSVVAVAEAYPASSDQIGVLQAQMIEVRSHLDLPWRAGGAEEPGQETGGQEAQRRTGTS
jgi:transcriptional regulator with XRE-family HTH domain